MCVRVKKHCREYLTPKLCVLALWRDPGSVLSRGSPGPHRLSLEGAVET